MAVRIVLLSVIGHRILGIVAIVGRAWYFCFCTPSRVAFGPCLLWLLAAPALWRSFYSFSTYHHAIMPIGARTYGTTGSNKISADDRDHAENIDEQTKQKHRRQLFATSLLLARAAFRPIGNCRVRCSGRRNRRKGRCFIDWISLWQSLSQSGRCSQRARDRTYI